MTANENLFHAKTGYRLMNVRFRAANVSKKGAGLQVRADGGEILGIVFHGCTQENKIALPKLFSDAV